MLVLAMECSGGRQPSIEQQVSGGHSGGVTPVPIPNTEVKPASADGTWGEAPWESRSPPDFSSRRSPPRRGLRRVRPWLRSHAMSPAPPPRKPAPRRKRGAEAAAPPPRKGWGSVARHGAHEVTPQPPPKGARPRGGTRRLPPEPGPPPAWEPEEWRQEAAPVRRQATQAVAAGRGAPPHTSAAGGGQGPGCRGR